MKLIDTARVAPVYRAAMDALGMTQTELSARTEINQGNISGILNCVRPGIRPKTHRAICKALGLDPSVDGMITL